MSERFAAKLAELGAPAPWSVSREEPGELIDANGRAVLVVDHGRQISDTTAAALAAFVRFAVNSFAEKSANG